MFFEWLDRVLKKVRLVPATGMLFAFFLITWAVLAASGLRNKSSLKTMQSAQTRSVVPDSRASTAVHDAEAEDRFLASTEQARLREKMDRDFKQINLGSLAVSTSNLKAEFDRLKKAFES